MPSTLRPDDSQARTFDEVMASVRDFIDRYPPERTDPVAYLRARFDAGLAWVDKPLGLGGLGCDAAFQGAVEESLERAGAERLNPNRNPGGTNVAAQTILTFGTEEQQKKWLKPLWTAEEIWCQLFSEPGAGSDLAALGTRAVREHDAWRVNGQKVWTSHAQDAKWGLLLARTDPNVPKHQGITYFVCDMQADGVDVRPLRQITGEAEFNEVFLTDVVIPDENRIGAVGAGWSVTQTSLSNERMAAARDPQPRGVGMISDIIAAWNAGGRDPDVERDIIDAWIGAESLRLLAARLAQLEEAGRPGPEGSGLKLASTVFKQTASTLWLQLLGDNSLRYTDWTMRRPGTNEHVVRDAAYTYLRTRASSIEAGTSEIMRNIIAERILGLPAETNHDREIAWKDLER
ncbi:acyl-CoA dehydrogenase family protein [Rhodococcus sp. T7]|uniref:acyl-CoA dehydrogenase family protein n=1 Tax=Rhodococcus sp. T7 TaxID=627444 RepID=UPI0013CD0644|nr:acyl-CoA dehydrogenase family protein [Rhodococcus sp. T7]KAF0957999.1 Crotonobetainyl-CoA dehydrogenase [Rhodococcus sp. T7]KAF0960158.1 Crotonobetainyl-CoA dehydrogenase [Rhodococcus sp. T7]